MYLLWVQIVVMLVASRTTTFPKTQRPLLNLWVIDSSDEETIRTLFSVLKLIVEKDDKLDQVFIF